MYFALDDEGIVSELRRFKKRYPAYIGFDYLMEILNVHGKKYHPSELYSRLHTPFDCYIDLDSLGWYIPELNYQIYEVPELPIEITDRESIKQIGKRICILNLKLQDAKQNNDIGRMQEYAEEINLCRDYLAECLTRNGTIRAMNSLAKKHKHLIKSAINNAIKIIAAESPFLAKIIEDNIVIGIHCYWKQSPCD